MSFKTCQSHLGKNKTKPLTIIGLLIDMEATTHNTPARADKCKDTATWFLEHAHTPIKQVIVESIKHIWVTKSGTKVRQRSLQIIHSNK